MGFFSRLGTLLRSNINELINRAEDPEKMLNQVLVDMKSQLVEAKKQVAMAIADEKRLKKQCEQELAKVAEWERKAMLAVKSGDDGLARAALQRKAEHEETATALGQQWEAQKQSVERLKEALRGLDNKIEEAKRKRNLLVSRQKRAEAQQMINETLTSISSNNSFDTFERMSERVTQLEAQAEATAELGAVAGEGAKLEQQFRALEAGSVDDALAKLKSQMALGAASDPTKAISGEAGQAPEGDQEAQNDAPPSPEQEAPAAAAPPSGIDSQLEELKRKLSSS